MTECDVFLELLVIIWRDEVNITDLLVIGFYLASGQVNLRGTLIGIRLIQNLHRLLTLTIMS